MPKKKKQPGKSAPQKRKPLNPVGAFAGIMPRQPEELFPQPDPIPLQFRKLSPDGPMAIMTPEAIKETAARILPGGSLRVQFKPDGIDGVGYLVTLNKAGVIQVKEEFLMLAVVISRKWEYANRIFTVTVNEYAGWYFDGTFVNQLESIELL